MLLYSRLLMYHSNMKLYLYETNADLYPLDLLRFQCDIYVGARTIRERAEVLFKSQVNVISKLRPALLDVPSAPSSPPFDAGLFCPANLIPRIPISVDGPEEVGIDNGRIVFVRLHSERARKFNPEQPESSIEGLRIRPISGLFLDKIWDIVRYLPLLLNEDVEFALKNGAVSTPPKHVLFDTSHGSVAYYDSAIIEPFSFITGPAVIGKNATIKAHSTIRNSAINEGSRVGGELNSSIFFPFSNKQHDGFIGHSVVGSWVNIGAGTTGSNLKNTYGLIKIKGIDSGLNYLGQIIGDHTKIGIQCAMNTGSVYGICSNIIAGFDSGSVLPKEISSFRFGTEPAEIESVIRTAKIVYSRREKEFPQSIETLIRAYHNIIEC